MDVEQKVSPFKKAEKKKVWLKIALTGPSGSGKTLSALLMATGIGKRIALIDTENQSASLYADQVEFDTLPIEPPYTIKKYVDAIQSAQDANYDVLILDSITHAWAAEGGLLEKKDTLDKAGRGNSYTNWNTITKEHELFKARLLQAQIHMICTMRSKQDYILVMNDKGKQEPKKVGMAPIQRDGMEYEFTSVLDLSMEHYAQSSKDRTNLFDGLTFKPSKKTGEDLMAWLSTGKGELERKPVITAKSGNEVLITEDQRTRLWTVAQKSGWTKETLKPWLKKNYGLDSTTDVPVSKYEKVIQEIQRGAA